MSNSKVLQSQYIEMYLITLVKMVYFEAYFQFFTYTDNDAYTKIRSFTFQFNEPKTKNDFKSLFFFFFFFF